MTKEPTPPSPHRFGMASFAELLPDRDPILGEDPGTFAVFRDGVMRALTPFTPYECMLAENLVAIEWELFQHRRMRDACLRKDIRSALAEAVVARERERHEEVLDAKHDAFIAEGGNPDDWEDPYAFDEAAATSKAGELAARAVSSDPHVQQEAHEELVEMGLSPVEFMSDAWRSFRNGAATHDATIERLERRRREVRRDYDLLQKSRPVDAEVARTERAQTERARTEGAQTEVADAEIIEE
jgi:hypothetical protein